MYALGCVVYQCLTGRRPFAGDVRETLRVRPPRVTATRPDVDPAVDAIVARALAKRPDDRYPTCRELAAALAQVAARETDLANASAVRRYTVRLMRRLARRWAR